MQLTPSQVDYLRSLIKDEIGYTSTSISRTARMINHYWKCSDKDFSTNPLVKLAFKTLKQFQTQEQKQKKKLAKLEALQVKLRDLQRGRF